MTLRELRLWHWQNAMRSRAAANDRRASRHTNLTHHRDANFHIKAVQALNECFPDPIDTAEQDERNGMGHH